ncbi:turripeptide OL11-like [Haematobia irritans]|uniref:Putative kazal type serine protease inhibitor n=1 Tax=Haematobia irritans TaxID=7368 RepID=A0A1L8E760_HAEIR
MRFLFLCFTLVVTLLALARGDDCLRPCPMNFSPVCGEHDGSYNTYPNECAMEAAACKLGKSVTKAYDGECK